MIPVVITSSAYEQNESACMQQVCEMIQSMPSRAVTLLIDANSLKASTHLAAMSPAICRVNLSEWIDSTHQPIKVAIRAKAKGLSTDQLLLLDASQHDAYVIDSVLHEVSQTWFYLKAWLPAFILVVDDHLANRFAQRLSDVFYVKSQLTSKLALHTEMRHLRRLIFSRRWLGFGRASRLAGAVYQFTGKLKHYVHRKLS